MLSIISLMTAMAIIFFLIFKKVNAGIALFIGAFLFGILVHGPSFLNIAFKAFDLKMLNTLLTFVTVIFLTEIMRIKGVATKIVEGLNVLGSRITAIITPLIIGLLPMPGGAYISATISKPIYDNLDLKPEEEAYINYWFRHVLTMSWPLVPGVIIVAGIIGIEPHQTPMYTWPIPLASIMTGLAISLSMVKSSKPLKKDVKGLIHLWPIIITILVVLITGISLLYVLIPVCVVYMVISGVNYGEFREAILRALNPTILAVVIAAFIFSEFIQFSNVGVEIFNILEGWRAISSFSISFIIGFVIGIESVSMALSFSILATSVPAQFFIYAFLGVYVGHLLSPSHPCLVMTVEYFEPEYSKIYKYITLSAFFTILITVFLAHLF